MSKPVDFMIHIHLDDERYCDGCPCLGHHFDNTMFPTSIAFCKIGHGIVEVIGLGIPIRSASCVAMSDKQEQCKISGKII